MQAPSVASSGGKGKGVKRGPRGSSGFDLFKKQVRKDMKAAPGVAADHKFTLAEVAAECARRRAAGEYDEAFWKAQATAAKTTTSAAATDDESETSTPSKGRGRPKGSKNKVSAGAPSVEDTPPVAPKASKKAPPPPPVSDSEDDEDDEDDVPSSVPWEFKKKQYFKSPTTHEVWDNKDGMPSDEPVGRWNKVTNRIEPL